MTTSFEPITVAPFSDALAARTSELLEDTGVLSEEELETLVTRIAARPDLWQPLVVVDRERRRYELLYDDDQVDIWVLSWMPGQKTGLPRSRSLERRAHLRPGRARRGEPRARHCAPSPCG